ncbi:hypothetical protein CYL16_18370 [Mycobacterium sp. EPG1]|nr:hypothetical protein CYL16_18370 [Mycobacterium sp. EPG1]
MVTISVVEASAPQRLTDTAASLAAAATTLTSTVDAQRRALTALRAGWPETDTAGTAADTGIARLTALSARLTAMQRALAGAGTNLTALREQILPMRDQVIKLGGKVDDDGTVAPLVRPFGTMQLLTPAVCASYTHCFTALLTQFDNADEATANALGVNWSTPASSPDP